MLGNDKKSKGNPNLGGTHKKQKGEIAHWNKKTIATLSKLRRNPIEELINLADLARANKNYNLAAEIWKDIQQYREPKRKPIEVHETPTTPEEAKENVENMLNLLEEVSDGREDQTSGDTASLDTRTPQIFTEAGPEKDVRGDTSLEGTDIRS